MPIVPPLIVNSPVAVAPEYCNSNSYQTTWNDKYYKYKILVYKITNKIFFGIPKKVCNICQRIKSG